MAPTGYARLDETRDAPYDPHLPFLFFGEEVSMAVRMWTRGYDLYAPDAPVLLLERRRDYKRSRPEVGAGALRLPPRDALDGCRLALLGSHSASPLERA